jgi:AAA domain
VAVVVGRAGTGKTGKTFALGMARHGWQLGGYRLLACAPTGIATVTLEGEGFEEMATCDRLLADLDRHHETLDGRTVLVVDEAGMLAAASSPACSTTLSRAGPRWCWSETTGSWRRSTPAAASAPCGSGSAPAS